MTVAAARPAAVLCALRRAVAGSRALHVMLFLGGLLTIGFLFAGQAEAAESPAPHVRAQASAAAAEAETWAAGAGADIADSAPVREVRETAADPVTSLGEVTRPVTAAARDITAPLGEVLPGPQPPGGDVPGLPVDPPSAGADATNPGDGPAPETDTVAGSAAPSRADAASDDSRAAARSAAVAATYVPDASTAAGHHDGAARGPQPGEVGPDPTHAPEPFAPCNSRQGTVPHSGESHTFRMGDHQAATLSYGSPGVFAGDPRWVAAEPPTRDRPRDILEFPG
ncbi:hypothetical protein [Streptomyces sp. NPDC058572]|uniref:hypothetical protein n=1 Tax=Streptomyces sp. NPDC058572 TaxID=3346546 RepID=UPI003650B5BD